MSGSRFVSTSGSSRSRGAGSTRVLALVVTAGVALAVGTSTTASASSTSDAATGGYIRAAHLVPDLPAMDVTLSRFSGAGTGTQTPMLKIEAAYGDVGSYAPLDPGFYAVSLRPAGAPASSAPILATTLEVERGGVYTAAGVGTADDARLAVFADDLQTPATGSARVRVVNAARTASPANVKVSDGTVVAAAAGYAVPTSYARVPAGDWQLTASSVGSTAPRVAGTTDIELASGGVYTLLVLENTAGGLRVAPILDAAGSGVVPQGGAATGFGGAATPEDLTVSAALLALTAAVGGLAVVGGLSRVTLSTSARHTSRRRNHA